MTKIPNDRTGGGWFVPLFRGVHVVLVVMLLGFILYVYAMQEWQLNRLEEREENSDSGAVTVQSLSLDPDLENEKANSDVRIGLKSGDGSERLPSVRKEVLDKPMFLTVFSLVHFLILIFMLLLHNLSDTLVFKKIGLTAISFTPNVWYFVITTMLLAIMNLGSLGFLHYLPR